MRGNPHSLEGQSHEPYFAMGASSVYKMPVYIVHKVPEIEKECLKHSFCFLD